MGLLFATPDIVYLKSGGTQEGNVTDQGDSYRVDRGNGITLTIKKSDVDRVVPCKFIPEPPRDRRARRWGRRHVDAKNFLRIDPPEGWSRGAPKGKAVASFYHDDSNVRFDVLLQRNPKGFVPTVDAFRRALQKSLGREAVRERSLKTGKRDAKLLEADFMRGDRRHRSVWVFIEASGDRIFTVALAAPVAAAREHGWKVRDAAESLRGLPERSFTAEQRARFALLIEEGEEEEPRQAVVSLMKALKMADDFSPAELLLAQAHVALGQGGPAEAAFQRAIKSDPADVRAAVAYGRFLIGRTDFRGAEKLLDPLSDRHRFSIDVHLALAQAFIGRGKFLDARRCATHAARLDRRCVEAHYLQGLCYEKLGKKNDARLSYRAAIIQDKDYGPAREGLKRLGWGTQKP